MKCEICNEKDAQTAITVTKDGVEDELYVCHECARKERLRRQKKSQRTRKAGGPGGMTVSITRIGGGDEPPPLIAALMDAMGAAVSDIEKMSAEESEKRPPVRAPEETPKLRDYPCGRIDAALRVAGRLHLEGLSLVGDMEAVQRAFRALGMEVAGVDADGVRDAGHAYVLRYDGEAEERAKRALDALLVQERNARTRLKRELPRVFADALGRALAVLKNARLLSPGELFDLLSPIRLGAIEGLLDGITRKEVERLMASVDLSSKEDDQDYDERDRIDAERADEMNERFEDVVLNERAEEMFQ